VIRSLHKRQLLFLVVVVSVVSLVLAQGLLQQDESVQTLQDLQNSQDTQIFEVSEIEVSRPPIVRADLEKTPLTYVSDYWAQLAAQAEPHMILVGESKIPAVLISSNLAVTTASAAITILEAKARAELTSNPVIGDAEVLISQDEVEPFSLRGWNTEIGLALFDVIGSNYLPFTLSDPRAMPSGSYLGAVTLRSDGISTITPVYLLTTINDWIGTATDGDLVVSMALPATVSIAAIVNLDGDLVGLAYKTQAGHHKTITATRLLSLIGEIETETVCRGIEVSDLGSTVSEMLVLQSGVLIEYVLAEAFDPRPSLRAGDVLLEWAGQSIQSADEFRDLYDAQEAGELVRFRVIRSGRRISGGTIMPSADCKPLRSDPIRLLPYGMAVDWVSGSASSAGWQVIAVAPDGPSDQAGVEEGDWLVAINRVVVEEESDRSILERAAEGSSLMLVSIRRNNRVKLVAISPRVTSDDE
jgi:S1-C subfamily serine protease